MGQRPPLPPPCPPLTASNPVECRYVWIGGTMADMVGYAVSGPHP